MTRNILIAFTTSLTKGCEVVQALFNSFGIALSKVSHDLEVRLGGLDLQAIGVASSAFTIAA